MPDLTQNVTLKQWPQRHFHGNAAWLGCSLCCAASQTSSTDGRAAGVTGGPFYFPLRAPHYGTRRSDLMAHRRNSSPKLSKRAANPPICEMWREPFRRSRISFRVAWFCVGAVRPAATLLLSDQGTQRGVCMIPVTAIPIFYDTFPLTPLFGCMICSRKCQTLSNGQRNVTLLIYFILEVQVQAERGKNCQQSLKLKKKYQVFVCLRFYFFNFRSMKQLSVYNRKSTQDTQETWNLHRKENNWHFK